MFCAWGSFQHPQQSPLVKGWSSCYPCMWIKSLL
jgi:hypothetical protein